MASERTGLNLICDVCGQRTYALSWGESGVKRCPQCRGRENIEQENAVTAGRLMRVVRATERDGDFSRIVFQNNVYINKDLVGAYITAMTEMVKALNEDAVEGEALVFLLQGVLALSRITLRADGFEIELTGLDE